MDFSPRLSLPYIASQQAQKQVTYNEAIKALDLLVQPAVASRTLTAPPGSPAEGDTYIVGPSATGLWGGKDNEFAVFVDGAWSFRPPAEGWLSYVLASAEIVVFVAGAWSPVVTNGGSTLALLGVNTTADPTSRLAVASAASLFTHEGTSHRLMVNKAAAADTGSILFQNDYSGRAEFGVCGDDDFHIKVSPDGSTWYEALTVTRTSGLVSLPIGRLAFPASQNASTDAHTLDDYEEGAFSPGISFGGNAVGVTYHAVTAGRYTKVGRLVTAAGLLFLTSKGSSTGAALLTGLPFATANVADFNQSGAVGYSGGLASIVGTPQLLAAPNGTTVTIGHSNNGASAVLTHANFTNSSFLYFALTYEAIS